MKRFSIVLFVLICLMVTACAGREPEAAPGPTRTPRPTDAIPPTWTPAPTETPSPTRTPEPTETSSTTEVPLFNQDGEVLEDGWIRYTVPDAMVAVELPEEFYVVRLDEELMNTIIEEGIESMPDVAQRYDMASLFAQNVRLFAMDVATNANLSIVTVNMGNIPLNVLMEPNIRQLDQMGVTDRTEPEYFTINGYDAAKVSHTLLVEGVGAVRNEQLFLVSDGVFHVINFGYSLTDESEYAPLTDVIFDRVEVVGGVTS